MGSIQEVGIDFDHNPLHLLISPHYSLNKIAGIIKKNTSKTLWAKLIFSNKVYGNNKEIWAKGYFVYLVRINERIIREYIWFQEKEGTGQAELEFWKNHTCKGLGLYN